MIDEGVKENNWGKIGVLKKIYYTELKPLVLYVFKFPSRAVCMYMCTYAHVPAQMCVSCQNLPEWGWENVQ